MPLEYWLRVVTTKKSFGVKSIRKGRSNPSCKKLEEILVEFEEKGKIHIEYSPLGHSWNIRTEKVKEYQSWLEWKFLIMDCIFSKLR